MDRRRFVVREVLLLLVAFCGQLCSLRGGLPDTVELFPMEGFDMPYEFNLDDGATVPLAQIDVDDDRGSAEFAALISDDVSVTNSIPQLTVGLTPSPTCLAAPSGAVAWWRAESNTVDSVGINDALFPDQRLTAAYMVGKV